jgi:thymidylate synthase
MFNDYIAGTINDVLPDLCGDLLNAPVRQSRNGEMRENTNVRIRLTNPLRREILLPERRASYPAQIAESMWVLAGRNDVEWLSHYLPRAADFSDDGATWRGGYGPRIRDWGGLDQLRHVVELLKVDPDTRRAVMAIYDPARDSVSHSAGAKDIPCNDFLQFLIRDNRLHLTVFTRSNDVIWGWSGINQFEWSFLLEIVAGLVGAQAGDLIFNITSLHLYSKHYDRARRIAESKPVYASIHLPKTDTERLEDLDADIQRWFVAEEVIRTQPGVNPTPAIWKVRNQTMRLWLRVLAEWWGRKPLGEVFLDTQYKKALRLTPGGPPEQLPENTRRETDFTRFASALHAEKHAVYGDSWKRRGEFLGILANIARKIDRLGEAGAGDTSADTAVDLLIYLVKYRLWLRGVPEGPKEVRADLENLATFGDETKRGGTAELIAGLKSRFDTLEIQATDSDPHRLQTVTEMVHQAYPLAQRLWWLERNQTRAWKGYDEEAPSGD